MKAVWLALFIVGLAGVSSVAGARDQARDRSRDRVQDPAVCQCVDLNGDGVCDKCGACVPKGEDADGDGIPNGQDPDYVPPQDGSGRR